MTDEKMTLRSLDLFNRCGGCGSTDLGQLEELDGILKAPDGTAMVLFVERRECLDCAGGVMRRRSS